MRPNWIHIWKDPSMWRMEWRGQELKHGDEVRAAKVDLVSETYLHDISTKAPMKVVGRWL